MNDDGKGGDGSTDGLICLEGEQPSEELAKDLEALLGLKDSAKERLWDILGPSLAVEIPDEAAELARRYCEVHDVTRSELSRAVRGARFLLHAASRTNLEAEDLAADIRKLSDRAEELYPLLVERYESVKQTIRSELLVRSLADHGKMLTDVKWRVDRVVASEYGKDFEGAVAVVTLRFLEGGRPSQVTLHAPPHMLERMRAMCNDVLG